MNEGPTRFYEFDSFRLDPQEKVLFRDGQPVPLSPKLFDTLCALVERAGHVVDKSELIREVWPDTFVEENNLPQYVSALRKILGDERREQRFIETIPRRGYRFTAQVTKLLDGDLVVTRHTRELVTLRAQEIAYEETDDESDRQLGFNPFRWLTQHPKHVVGAIALASVIVVSGVLLTANRSKPVASGAPIKSIAVLPFKNLSGDEADEYLGLGLADMLTTRLGKFKQITVRPSNAGYKYRAVDRDPVAAGRELGVEAVLDGSIQKSGERIRVTMQFVRTSDGLALWTDDLDGKLSDLFSVQDSISNHVANAISIPPNRDVGLEKTYTNNSEAYQEYLKGRYFWNKRTLEGFEKAIEHFEKARALDPGYALAYAGIANALMLHQRPDYPSAKEMALKALALDDSLAEAHTAVAYYESAYEWNWQDAEKEFQRAIQLNPNYATAHHWYAYHLASTGKMDQALAQINEALRIDPLSLIINTDQGHMLYLARRFDEAIAVYQRVLDMDPNFSVAHLRLGEAYIQKGKTEAATAELRKAASLNKTALTEWAEIGYIYAMSGRKADARRVVEQLQGYAGTTYVIAWIYVTLDKEQAFNWLAKACVARDPALALYKVEPLLEPLRSDPRYHDLLARLNLSE